MSTLPTTPGEPAWNDYFGRAIEVGDKVVYGVYTRNGSLQHGIVTDLIATPKFYAEYLPATRSYAEERHIGWITKVQIAVPSSKRDPQDSDKWIPGHKKQTLDSPSRFAVIEKGVGIDGLY